MSTISFEAVFQAVEENLAFFHLMLISQAALYHEDYDPITGEDLEVAREETAKYSIRADRKKYLVDDFRRNPEHYKFLLAYHALNGICHAMDWVLDIVFLPRSHTDLCWCDDCREVLHHWPILHGLWCRVFSFR